MKPSTILVILLLTNLENVFTITAYHSMEALNATNPLAGLTFDVSSVSKATNFTKGITFCIRFNFKLLSRESTIFATNMPTDDSVRLLLSAGYHWSLLYFGGLNWILKESVSGSFELWSTNRWHSICLGFDKLTSRITLIKVCEPNKAF